jgi:Bacterial pre-peptidase C-terminal domain
MTDNSLGNARNLGALSNKAVVRRDLVNLRDRTDFYKFTLNRSSNATFNLSGLQANADLIMLNGAGKAIARSRKGGNQAEQVNRQLDEGTYYIQVVGRGSKQTRYKLTGSASDGGGGGGGAAGNGTRNNPIDLGTLTNVPVTRSQDKTLPNDRLDLGGLYYKFNLAQISDISVRMAQVSGDSEVEIYFDSNRNGVWDSPFDRQVDTALGVARGSTTSNTSFTNLLPTGTYFMRATTRASPDFEAQYDLTLLPSPAPVPGNLPTDPGIEESTAYNLGALNRGGKFDVKDYVGSLADNKDVFRFNLSESATVAFTSKLTAGFTNTSSNSPTIRIFRDSNGNNFIEESEQVAIRFFRTNGDQQVDSSTLQAGNYFVTLDGTGAGTGQAYSLEIAAS